MHNPTRLKLFPHLFMYSHHQHLPYIRMILYQSSILCLRAAALLTQYQLPYNQIYSFLKPPSHACLCCLQLLASQTFLSKCNLCKCWQIVERITNETGACSQLSLPPPSRPHLFFFFSLYIYLGVTLFSTTSLAVLSREIPKSV